VAHDRVFGVQDDPITDSAAYDIENGKKYSVFGPSRFALIAAGKMFVNFRRYLSSVLIKIIGPHIASVYT